MRTKTLRTALVANAIFSGLTGVTLFVFADAVAGGLGAGAPLLYRSLGAGLLAFAAFVAWTGTARTIDTFRAALISLADLAWVMGTIVLIAATRGTLDGPAVLAILLVAAVVLLFGVQQLRGIAEVYRDPSGADAYVLSVEVESSAAPEQLWPMLADLGGIVRHAPQLKQAVLRDPAATGVGTVRQCTDTGGRTWAERCRRFDPGRRILEFDFLADEPGFPFPFGSMAGGWAIEPLASGSTVMIWFRVTPKVGPAHPFVLAVMARRLEADMRAVVERMSVAARAEVGVGNTATPP